jgi:hypothetical protein
MERSNINIARSIAPLLLGGWRFDELETDSRKNNYTHPAVIICGKYQMIFKDSSKNLKDRIEIYCVICPAGRGGQIYNIISVNRNRPIKAILQEIKRRCLVGYLEKYKKVQTDIEKTKKANEEYFFKIGLFKKFIPEFKHHIYSEDRLYTGNIDLSLSKFSEIVNLQLSLDMETAFKILGILKDLGKI